MKNKHYRMKIKQRVNIKFCFKLKALKMHRMLQQVYGNDEVTQLDKNSDTIQRMRQQMIFGWLQTNCILIEKWFALFYIKFLQKIACQGLSSMRPLTFLFQEETCKLILHIFSRYYFIPYCNIPCVNYSIYNRI